MHAASRDALEQLKDTLDKNLQEHADAVQSGAAVGAELFDIVDVLDNDRSLRVALVDSAAPPQQRAGLVTSLLEGKVSSTCLEIMSAAVSQQWSDTRDFRNGLVAVGRRALLRSAEAQGQLDRVEGELFRLARIMEQQPELELLLADKSADADARRGLFAQVLYGKVTAITEALALQAVGRGNDRPVENLDALCDEVAALGGREVARVRSAVPLAGQQQSLLVDKLEKIYGRTIVVHSEVDSSLLGGAVIRVGNEVIDGSTAGKLRTLRRSLV